MSTQTITFPERPECAEHRARLTTLERSLDEEKTMRRDLSDKLDSLKMWVMTTLAAALVQLLVQMLQHK